MFQHLVEVIMKNKGSSKNQTQVEPVKGPVRVYVTSRDQVIWDPVCPNLPWKEGLGFASTY